MTVKDLRKFIFENYVKLIGFTKKESYYSLKKQKKKDLVLFATNVTKKKYETVKKAKEHYELFLKNKGKKYRKVSKSMKKPSNGDIKSVTVRHYETASDLLKPIKQSKIITRELETTGKGNIFSMESITVEHPKTVAKSPNPIKHPSTQQPKKNKSLYRVKTKRSYATIRSY